MPYVAASAITAPAAFKAAQAASLFLSAAAAGGNLGLTVFTVPRLLESPVDIMLGQWRRMFAAGHKTFPALAVLAALAHAYVYAAARRGAGAAVSKAPLLAGALCLAVAPYTVAVLYPTNAELSKRANAAAATASLSKAERAAGGGVVMSAADEQSSRQLLDTWGTLNLGRGALLASASVLGLVTYL